MLHNAVVESTGRPGSERVRLSEILGALSYALDLTEGQPAGHCLRSCWIGLNIGQELGLDAGQLWEVYYTILLKDVGCSSNAARICQLYLSDDLTFKHDYKLVDGSLRHLLGFVMAHAGLQAPLAERFRVLVNIFRNGGEISRELIETRCQRGADIARKLRFSDAVAGAILSLDEHWNGGGMPLGLGGARIPLPSRIALLAQVVDVFSTTAGKGAAREEARLRCGTWFDPRAVAAFERVAEREDFWAMLASPEIERTVYAMEPAQGGYTVDDTYLDDIAQGFAEIIDSKSPYTCGHSERVARYTDLIAGSLGIESPRRARLRRAALLHDVGKLGVSNTILDKPGRLDPDEWSSMRRHPAFSRTILSRIEAFTGAARVGGDHHERLDGGGYPRGLKGGAIDLDTRIVSVADVFDALTARRPYRDAMTVGTALGIMAGDVGSAFDPRCFEALCRNFSSRHAHRLDAA